jgi:D-alanyl-D-alanine carboxypeptidase
MVNVIYSRRNFKQKKPKPWQRPKLLFLVLGVLLLAFVAWIYAAHKDEKSSAATSRGGSPSVNSQSTAPAFNKTQYSINDPTSIWVVVNKGRVLPSTYAPSDLAVPTIPLRLSSSAQEMHLRKEAATALQAMSAAANSQGIHLMLASGYRSYSTQVSVYGAEVKNYGLTQADRESARPGHSEHQSGLAADLEPASRACEVTQCFAGTPEGKWLAANSYTYGFIIRYQKDKENITGYEYEPWHVRYVGADLAKQIQGSGQVLEQFFGLPIFTTYPKDSYQLN